MLDQELPDLKAINNGYCGWVSDEIIGFLNAFEDDETSYRQLESPRGYPGHFWIEYKGRHYDAEAPDGVELWTDLPIFKR